MAVFLVSTAQDSYFSCAEGHDFTPSELRFPLTPWFFHKGVLPMAGQMVEIRWHARGGQGAKTAAMFLAEAVLIKGKFGQGFININ